MCATSAARGRRSTGCDGYCSSTREAFAIPREIRYANVIAAVAVTKPPASTASLAAQMIANRISTKNHIAHSALPGIGRGAPVGQLMIGGGAPAAALALGGAGGGGGGGSR